MLIIYDDLPEEECNQQTRTVFQNVRVIYNDERDILRRLLITYLTRFNYQANYALSILFY